MHMGVTIGREPIIYRGFEYDPDEKITKTYDGPETAWAVIGSATMDGEADAYSWNMVQVWQHRETRALAIAHASGCSCYALFDDATVKGLTFLSRLADFDQFLDGREKTVEVYDAETRSYTTQRHPRVVDQIVRLREQVGGLVRKQRSRRS